MTDELEVLQASVARLRELVEPFGPAELRAQAYPTEWSIADVLSHIGSGALITTLLVEHALGGPEVDPQPIWGEWNTKDPERKAADALRADAASVERLSSLTPAERDRIVVAVGPMRLGFAAFVQLRIKEHTLHIWDIEVVFDRSATLPSESAAAVLDVIPTVAPHITKPTESSREVRVLTSQPDRAFVVRLSADGVSVEPTDAPSSPDLELPSEAFVRLTHGRLDPEHTPEVRGSDEVLGVLRSAFPGF